MKTSVSAYRLPPQLPLSSPFLPYKSHFVYLSSPRWGFEAIVPPHNLLKMLALE
jgi:hypothetical protein